MPKPWENSELMTLGPQRIHSKTWGPLRKVKARTRQRKFQYLGFRPDRWWRGVGHTGWVWRGTFKQRRAGFWWAQRVSLKGGGCAVDPGVQQDCWSQGRSHLVQVLTGLAGVSSRTCRLTAPQTDAEAATAWSNSWELSTLLCMILLIRSTTMSK